MNVFKDFEQVVRLDEPLAMHTWFHLGGPAEYFADPRTPDELAALVRRSREENTMVRMLGAGSNVLVRDEGVSGLVLRLLAPAFCDIQVEGEKIRVGAGARLSHVVTTATHAGLAGTEQLVHADEAHQRAVFYQHRRLSEQRGHHPRDPLGQHDVTHALHIVHAHGLGALDLASLDGFDAGANDLAHEGAGIEAQRQDPAFPLIQAPAEDGQRREREINDINLDQQRRGANGCDVPCGYVSQPGIGREAHDGAERAHHQGDNQAHGGYARRRQQAVA